MLQIILTISLLLFSACNVDVESSDGAIPIDNNTSDTNTSDTNTTDTNTTDTNTSGTTSNDTNRTEADLAYQAPETAEYDPNACYSGYATAVPLQDYNSNESPRESDDVANGISLMSLYQQTLNPNDSLVIAFYKQIPVGIVLEDATSKENVYGDNSQFILMYDPIWKSLENNIVYVQTPALDDALAKCFRITIEETPSGVITPQQVYRYNN